MAQVAESRNDDEEAGGDAEQSSPVTFAVLTPHQESIRNEIALMSICNHENIVKYHDGYYFKDRFWIFIEYMDAGCLTDILEAGYY